MTGTVVIEFEERMNKAFTKESDNEDDELDAVEEPARIEPAGVKNYITPSGLQRLERSSASCSPGNVPRSHRSSPGRRAMAIAARTPTISTESGGCVRSIGGFAF